MKRLLAPLLAAVIGAVAVNVALADPQPPDTRLVDANGTEFEFRAPACTEPIGGTTCDPTTTTTLAATTTTAAATTTTTAAATTTTAAATTTTMPASHHAHVPCPGETDARPLGTDSDQVPTPRPMLCDVLGPAIDTHVEGANSWVDDFNHGASMSELPESYVDGTVNTSGVSRHFIHSNHWMTDTRSDSGRYGTKLTAWMRPARRFTPKPDGSVVIEFEVAVPIAGTRGVTGISDSWPEFAITRAPSPSGQQSWGSPWVRNGLYFYEAFPATHPDGNQYDTFGCRMQQSRRPICAYMRPGSDGAGSPDREWEVNQNGTDVVPGSEYGGAPFNELANVWATCAATDDPDTVCRNTFRITITPATVNGVSTDRLRIDVKKPGGQFVRYYEVMPRNDRDGSLGQISRIIDHPGGFYVYFAGVAQMIENDVVLRFHWDRLAVNP